MLIQMGRRAFLQRAVGLAALTGTVPAFLQKTSLAFDGDPSRDVLPIPGLNDNRVLVVVQLAGGNDALNTVVPYQDDAYYRARPNLAIPSAEVLRINDDLGLHPELVELRGLLDDGNLAVVQGVGYPNPDRSHFRSTEIWETASPPETAWTDGWLGRYFDNECSGVNSPMIGLQLGERPAQTFAHPRPRAVTMANPAIFDWPDEGPLGLGFEQINQVEPTGLDELDYVQRTANATLAASRRIREAIQNDPTEASYAPFAFSQSLKLVAQMIAAEVPTRVYYVSLGGFDTHARQDRRHASLLQELSQGLAAFRNDLAARGHLDRTLVMTFSEFGRRVAENQSGGTDHGTAGSMLLMGSEIRPGLLGDRPDLSRLDDEGDPRFTVDFRSVYAAVLSDWFGADAEAILKTRFEPFPILDPARTRV
ncbi:DUF1501 domain-containing protein [Tautonia rosea]|uniref:DUF1501 domain-containing protein n=1 Tax=Tautonia rosea TaxID=2728037 RepID=UPI001472EEDD|nr:DUF1501 domain-containing protein [Tautonia rosea]